jgi:hypothetical protein
MARSDLIVNLPPEVWTRVTAAAPPEREPPVDWQPAGQPWSTRAPREAAQVAQLAVDGQPAEAWVTDDAISIAWRDGGAKFGFAERPAAAVAYAATMLRASMSVHALGVLGFAITSSECLRPLVWREFDENDWMAFGGAKCWTDARHCEPLIAELQVDGHCASAILDASGLHIHWNDGVESWVATFAEHLSRLSRVLARLSNAVTDEALDRFGFLIERC